MLHRLRVKLSRPRDDDIAHYATTTYRKGKGIVARTPEVRYGQLRNTR